MKKAKAIELLKLAVPIKALTQQEYSDFVEAVNMGMDALEHPTSPDTIDRKAALDALRRCQTYLFDARDDEKKIELSNAESAINEQPTVQPEAQWIPVGEKLPETEDFVLASLSGKYRNTTFEHACEIADYADGKWCIYAYPNMSAEKCAELIEAWMPLPTPYRKGAAT